MSSLPGLSILIPIYNFNVVALVSSLHQQIVQLGVEFEICCYDDASDDEVSKQENQKLLEFKNVIYKKFAENIGRSQIRNLLAKDGKYDLLLFIDSDSLVKDVSFVEKYLRVADECEVVAGGTVYSEGFSDEFSLRLKYGRKREQQVGS